uniref:Uncharacterized protein n=1 Tax=Anopheles farauti TaxID=69004 RepID=A0A182QL35_9DIPT
QIESVERSSSPFRCRRERDNCRSPPPTPAPPPSTPRKNKVPPDAMTVSVSQPQQPIESIHCGPVAATYTVPSAAPFSSSSTSCPSSSANPRAVEVSSPSMALSTATMASSSSSSSSSPHPGGSPGHARSNTSRCSPEPDSCHHGNHQHNASSSSTPTSALRRLYFKTARASKAAKMAATAATTATAVAASAASSSTVPKVVVMGSSTTSEATINTSTDSASTHITNVTTTTDTETNDSLDLGDVSGQSEPLLSSLDDESSSIIALNKPTDNEQDENITVINGPDTPLLISYQELEDLSPRSPMFSPRESAQVTPSGMTRTQQPRTAPVSSCATRFPFDPPMSPKTYSGGVSRGDTASFARTHETMFSFDESPNPVRRPPPKMPPEQTPDHSPNMVTDCGASQEPIAKERAAEPAQPPKQLMEPPHSSTSTPKRLMNSIKTRKERLVQQAGSAVAAATAAVTSAGTGSSKPFKNPNYDPDLTMFPFDREAIDYDRIQRECFAVEEELLFEHDRRSCGDSPSKMLYDAEIFSDHYSIFQQYAYLSQQEVTRDTPPKRNRIGSMVPPPSSDAFSPQRRNEQAVTGAGAGGGAAAIIPPGGAIHPRLSKFDQIATKFDMMPSKSSTGTVQQLPDLRVDYFAETSCCSAGISVSPSGESTIETMMVATAATEATAANKARASSPSSLASSGGGGGGLRSMEVVGTGALAAGAINVTPNPMEGAVCTQPRATIVVQQPSLSLDYTSVETILLKNEGDFISVGEQGAKGDLQSTQRKKQQREEHMRQLLDVTNTLTTEEIKDFEMRYGSPHHSRSQSVKTPGSRASGRPNQLCLPQQRSRVASMPNTGVEEEYYRLRHFSITGKGVVNRGDSLKSRRSKSNNSVASSNSSTEHLTPATGAVAGSARTSATCSLASSRESSTSNPASGPYKVLMLGGAAVGKSSLVSQFMTSEYLHAYDTSIDDDSGEKTVSVLLSGEESELTFIDHSYTEMAPENCMSTYDPHGYCVIYSSADKGSFVVAERILQILWTTENIAQKAVILVANKADLARSRMVTSDEGKAMATQYDCKFIETSVGINHNVDELLVGLLSQIRLKLENPEKSRDLFRKRSIRKSKRRACSPLGGAICLAGIGGSTNPSTPVSGPPASGGGFVDTPPGSAHSSPRKYRGSRTSASLKVKGLLGRVWARDSKSKSCENLHVL